MDDTPLKIPLPVFQKMLHKLTVDELKKLPPQSLPREVPNDVLRELDEEKRQVVDDLMFEVNSHHIELRLDLERKFGAEVMPALAQSDMSFSEIVRPSFVQQVQEYVSLIKRYVDQEDKALAEDVFRMEDVILPQTKTLGLARHTITDHKQALIKHFSLSKESKEEIEDAILRLKKQEQLLDVWLAKFFGAQLRKVRAELAKHRDHIQKNQDLMNEVDTQIEAIQKRIRVSIKAMGLTPQEVNTHHFIQSLRADINELENRRATQKTLVPESALIDLLDGFVDASLSPVIHKEFDQALKTTKADLFDLIQVYCQEQAKALTELDDKFSMATQAGSSDFSLKTEHFVLQYFMKKASKLSGNNFRPEQLDLFSNIEQELLTLIRGMD